MKKILILANNSGGLYRFRKELMSEMILKGYEVIASTPFDDNVDDLKQLGVKLINININRRGMNPIKDFKLLLEYFKLITRVKPSLIVTYTIKPNLYGCSVASFFNVPYAINITGLGTAFQNDDFIKKMVVIWYKFVCKKVKIVFFENEGNQNVFIENDIVDKEKCCVLNGAGVNLDDFPFTEYPLDENIVHFLFIGRIMKEKGIDELFIAIEKIHNEYNNVILDIVGNYEDNYENQINYLVDKGIVKFHGYQSNVKPFIQQAHCFVLPSYHEGMANTLLENASMGRPLITSNIYGCKEAVIENENGFLCESKNPESLYQKMKEFVLLDYNLKKQMGLNSRKHIEKNFDKKNVVSFTIKNLL